ncbi:MAG: hypothetical protein R3C02_23170 [Planctomycetaceae bacterium]
MLADVIQSLKSSWRSLIATDVLFKIISFVLLTPLVSLMFRGFLWLSGYTVLADADIANFLLHPLGWVTLVIVGGATIAMLSLEQAALMAVGCRLIMKADVRHGDSLVAWLEKATGVFRIAAEMVHLLLIAAPFVAVAGILYVLLLTDHDINYYLSGRRSSCLP